MSAVACYLILCITLVFQGAAPRKSDRELHGYKGPVKSVDTEYEEVADPSNGIPGGVITRSTVKFDAEGNWIGCTFRWADGTVQKDQLDSKTHIIESRTYNPKGVIVRRAHTVFDDRGRIIAVNLCKGDGQIELMYFTTYDDKGRIKESIVANPDGSTRSKCVNSYDPERNSRETVSYDGDGTVENRLVITRDDLGNVIESAAYDAKGRLTNKQSRTKDDLNTIHLYETFAPDGTLVHKQTCVMDQTGREIGAITYNPDGSIKQKLISEYKYDSRGNYIEIVTSRMVEKDAETPSEPVRIVRRKITYY